MDAPRPGPHADCIERLCVDLDEDDAAGRIAPIPGEAEVPQRIVERAQPAGEMGERHGTEQSQEA
jgi:hypothetical protein